MTRAWTRARSIVDISHWPIFIPYDIRDAISWKSENLPNFHAAWSRLLPFEPTTIYLVVWKKEKKKEKKSSARRSKKRKRKKKRIERRMRRGKRNRRKTAFTVHSSKYSHGWLHLWSNCGQMTASQYRVLSKIVERRGGREKENIKEETEGRREKKKKKLSLLQVRLRIWWKREPSRIETFGVQWRIENCPRDEWNREIWSAFSKMRRKYRVSALSCPSHFLLPFLRRFHLCSSSGQCGTMKWPWRFAFSANPFSFRDRDRVFTSAPFNFFGTLFIRGLGESIYSPMGPRCILSFRFHAPPRVFDFSVFLARSAISPI